MGRRVAGFYKPRLERFIGVIYRPETELPSHYAEAVPAGAVRCLGMVRRDDFRLALGRTLRGKACRIPIRSVCRVGGLEEYGPRLPSAVGLMRSSEPERLAETTAQRAF